MIEKAAQDYTKEPSKEEKLEKATLDELDELEDDEDDAILQKYRLVVFFLVFFFFICETIPKMIFQFLNHSFATLSYL